MEKKYNPMSKEFQNECKRLGLTGYQYKLELIKEGKVINPTDIKRKETEYYIKKAGCKTVTEYLNNCAQNRGFKDYNECHREYTYNIGRRQIADNPDCSSYFGVYIAENYIIQTFEDPIKMPLNNPGFDWLCKKGLKIQCKARCLNYSNSTCNFIFPIKRNNIADLFICSGWDNRDSLIPLHIWIFHKNDIVKYGRGYSNKREFWKRESFSITNNPTGLKKFERWEVTDRLDKLKEICNRDIK